MTRTCTDHFIIQHPRRTLAAILVASRKPLEIDDVELPERLQYGQVLVRVLFTGICGSQIGEIDAVKGLDRFLPHLLGHEASGEVLQCGPGVESVKQGDLCVMHWRKGKGIDAQPPRYLWRGKTCNAGWIATFAQFAVVSENRLTPVAGDLDPTVLPLFGCAVTTGLGVAANDAKIRPGESVVVFGAGGVGLSVIQGAVLMGAWPIIAVDLFDNRLDLAARFGATHYVNSARENVSEVTRDITREIGQPAGVDVCIDNTGKSEVISACYELVSPTGRLILVGIPKAGDKACIYTLPLHFGKSITGSYGGGTAPETDIPRYLRLYKAGKLKLDGLVTERYGLNDINEAIRRIRSGDVAGRCLIDCGHG